ncbi:hypothetical protein PAXRUDRAFT_834667 [Paxillus rubicundulus Ve08.2h10]|uniref:Uncharacterized protein n=1 Tax=Paxillus rubicundulus Ve08.2h10 TaxID=930991 RepID=A0A0D0DJ98_9AGAM|nr:hypothetical protein PAXRUDRAFT_834667 [Paxillus rubicundulus Ve08.2h10]
MVDHSIQRSMSQSFIPVVTPRPSRSSISNPFPVSQAPFTSEPRRTSVSSTQASPASTSTTTMGPPRTPVSSIPSFRSIRNLLPFGPGKTTGPSVPGPANAPKPSFVNFGPLRRITHDRKTSVSYNRPEESDSPPVIAIARHSETFEEEMMARKRSRDYERSTSNLSPSSRASVERYVLPAPSPIPPLGADLSTITEAENSGISKHIPYSDDMAHLDDDTGSPTSPFMFGQSDRNRLPSPDSSPASVLDLSTSKLNAEVMDALMVKDATMASEWLQGVNEVVVEESADDPHDQPREMRLTNVEKDPDATFDFAALDPDLAELLSPNKINDKSQISTPVRSRLPAKPHPRSPIHSFAPTPDKKSVSPRTSPRLGNIIPPSPASLTVIQSSPTRRTVSLSRANLARVPASSLPRLMRSVTNAPSVAGDSSTGSDTPSGLRGPPKRRRQPPSPLSSQAHSSQVPSPISSCGSTDLPARTPASSRLATPIRHVSRYIPGNSCLADTPAIHPSPTSDRASPVSQLTSRSTSDHHRQPHSQPSLEFGGTLEVNKRRRAHLFYSRKRSMSVEEARLSPASASSRTSPIRPSSSLSNRPPAMEWLGPRTVKAFAAAGLLDGDRDGSNHHMSGVGRYSTLRAGSEREERYIPSRMAFSEAASTSSWGRSGSVSRVMTPSEGGMTWTGSPTFSVPRTTFSGGSTAPTSISASSSAQQATMHLMKEKHDLETEALLSALSDSQRTTKTLREENIQLRDRIRALEDQLDEMRTQIHRLASGIPSPRPPHSSFSKPMHDRTIIPPTPLVVPRRPTMQRSLSHVHSNNVTMSSMDLGARQRAESPSHNDPLVRSRPRRASTTSSVFPNLPHNMSMLMLEETMHERAGALSTSSISPPSPTLCLPTYPSNITRGHTTHSSISSIENITPSTANFSMTEIPGSPTSLHLRPEHELHLGDMASLSLYAMSDEEL